MRKNSLLRTRSGLVMLLAAAGVSCLGLGSLADADDGLQPDTAFQLDCSQNARSDFDDQVTRYFTQQGFRVVDLAKLHADAGGDAGRHELAGIDRRNRIVRIVSFPRRPNHLSFTLLSMPPTRHDPGFDGAVQSFFSRDLICEVTQILTNDNTADSVANFEAEVAGLTALLQTAEGVDASASKH